MSPTISNFRYTGANAGNPLRGESLDFEIDPLPEASSYTWYDDNTFLATTTEPYYTTYDWSCGDHRIYVRASTACGDSELGGGEYYWGLCSSSYSYSAYPNPTSNQLTIESKNINIEKSTRSKNNTSNFSVKLYNEKGVILLSSLQNKGGDKINFDTQKIPDGTYFLHITEGKETIKKQIIIKH